MLLYHSSILHMVYKRHMVHRFHVSTVNIVSGSQQLGGVKLYWNFRHDQDHWFINYSNMLQLANIGISERIWRILSTNFIHTVNFQMVSWKDTRKICVYFIHNIIQLPSARLHRQTCLTLCTRTYLASAWRKIAMLSALAEEPMTQTTSPYSCMIWSISRVTEGVQSVNSDTNKGTLSICSRWGRILSIPRGSFAWNHHIYGCQIFQFLGIKYRWWINLSHAHDFMIIKITGELVAVHLNYTMKTWMKILCMLTRYDKCMQDWTQ